MKHSQIGHQKELVGLKWIKKKYSERKSVSRKTCYDPHVFIHFMIVVTNLRELFVNLGNSKARAISPTYDLAYMALLNGKDIEEAEDKTTQKKQDEKSAPPSQQQHHQQNGPVEKVQQQHEKQEDNTSALEEQEKENESSMEQQNENESSMEQQNVSPVNEAAQDTETHSTEKPSSSDSNESAQVSNTSTEKPPVSDTNDDSVMPDVDKENELPPSYDQVVKEKEKGDSSGALILYEKKPELPRRPSAANMMLGKQQDVTGKILIFLYEDTLI